MHQNSAPSYISFMRGDSIQRCDKAFFFLFSISLDVCHAIPLTWVIIGFGWVGRESLVVVHNHCFIVSSQFNHHYHHQKEIPNEEGRNKDRNAKWPTTQLFPLLLKALRPRRHLITQSSHDQAPWLNDWSHPGWPQKELLSTCWPGHNKANRTEPRWSHNHHTNTTDTTECTVSRLYSSIPHHTEWQYYSQEEWWLLLGGKDWGPGREIWPDYDLRL